MTDSKVRKKGCVRAVVNCLASFRPGEPGSGSMSVGDGPRRNTGGCSVCELLLLRSLLFLLSSSFPVVETAVARFPLSLGDSPCHTLCHRSILQHLCWLTLGRDKSDHLLLQIIPQASVLCVEAVVSNLDHNVAFASHRL